MEERNLGPSGLRVSKVGLGCNNFGGRPDLEASRKVIHNALDSGITLFDTADIYGNRGGSEAIIGEVLGARRKAPVTSVIAGATTPAQIEANVKAASWQLTAEEMVEVDRISLA